MLPNDNACLDPVRIAERGARFRGGHEIHDHVDAPFLHAERRHLGETCRLDGADTPVQLALAAPDPLVQDFLRDDHVRVAREEQEKLEELAPHVQFHLALQLVHDFDKLVEIINDMLGQIEQLLTEVKGVGDDIAHDLRTPLTRVRAALERGRDTATSLDDLRNSVDRGITGIDKALSVTSALLRIAAIEHGQRNHSGRRSDHSAG